MSRNASSIADFPEVFVQAGFWDMARDVGSVAIKDVTRSGSTGRGNSQSAETGRSSPDLAVRAPKPHNYETAGHEWRVTLRLTDQSSLCMGRKLFV